MPELAAYRFQNLNPGIDCPLSLSTMTTVPHRYGEKEASDVIL